jgi:NAD(P)-dependent dehydrogenase (short-subunit alcohol dehydrogenase family)
MAALPNQTSASDRPEASAISRRQMLTISTGALIGASILGTMKAATSSDDIGDKTPLVNFTLNGKSALVTGAARGIGQAICAALATAGADVLGLDLCAVVAPNLTYPPATEEQLAQTGKMVEGAKRRWIPVKGDIRDPKAMEAAVDRAVKEFGKLDIVVANAGIQAYGSLAEMPQDDWNNVIDINVKGTANTVRAALPHMLSRKYGRIVIIASGQGRHGFKNGSAYSASKWGLIGLMKSVAWEVGKDGITVNCVEPGLVDTPLTRNPGRWRELINTSGKQVPQNPTEEQAIAASAPGSVMGIPWMQPDEVAPAVIFLCTDPANRITGACIDAVAGESAKWTA